MSPTGRRLLASVCVLVVLAGPGCTDDDEPSAPEESTVPSTSTSVDEGPVDEVSLSDCPSDTDDAGVTRPTSSEPGVVRLVTSHPEEGAYAAAAGISDGARARFAVENGRGGVEVAGERYLIEVTALDDAGDPVATVANVGEAFDPQLDPAFAAFGVVGTDNVVAVRDRLTGWCVPDVFPVSASAAVSVLGGWSVGAPVVLETTEATTLVRYVTELRPDARVALLLPEGERGDRIESAFSSALEGSSSSVAAVARVPVGVDTDVRDEVTVLAASGADVFVDAAELLSCPAAIRVAEELAWTPLVLAAGGCATSSLVAQAGGSADGVLAATNLMDPASDRWRTDERVVAYRQAVESWADDDPGPVADPADPAVALGWTMGELFVRALSASSGVSRSELMASLTSIDASEVGLLFDEIRVATGPGDRWLGESARVVSFDADPGVWDPVGPVSSYEGGLAVPDDLRPGS